MMLITSLPTLLALTVLAAAEPASVVPAEAPRTWIVAGEHEAFVDFCTEGVGTRHFGLIKDDLDALYMDFPFPEEPPSFGDPDPGKRTSEKVDAWRAAQDDAGRVTGIAEAATLAWIVTGEERYLDKAQSFLLQALAWDPAGTTGIVYNDEAHFRLFRKLPLIYDQLRDTFTAEQRERIVAALRDRGERSLAWIKEREVHKLERNAVEREPSSHPVRFMAMTGVAGLALWDDIPEARDWFAYAYSFYRDIFTPWGGDDGGWAEGVAYWRGVYEHAIFQDALLAIGDPLAYDQPFWKQTGYFPVYFAQPYEVTSFGDLSNAGKINMEPGIKDFVEHLARVLGDGYLHAWTQLYRDPRPLPEESGLAGLYRIYPTSSEYLLRDFLGSQFPTPEPQPLDELPDARHFADIGWVSMHSALGQPTRDIQLSFKASPYGSFSHSHAEQNAFIINAYGRNLAINAGYREYHNSPMHDRFTRRTISKNAVLINGQGQLKRSKEAKGEIIGFQRGANYTWTAGDATQAYNAQTGDDSVVLARRDVVFIENRYFVIRDRVTLKEPGTVTWLLHAEEPIMHTEHGGRLAIREDGAWLLGRLRVREGSLQFKAWDTFPVEIDRKYVEPDELLDKTWITTPFDNQGHFSAKTRNMSTEHEIIAVLYPTMDPADDTHFDAAISAGGIAIEHPEGGMQRVLFREDGVGFQDMRRRR